jgi:hypothetical protein
VALFMRGHRTMGPFSCGWQRPARGRGGLFRKETHALDRFASRGALDLARAGLLRPETERPATRRLGLLLAALNSTRRAAWVRPKLPQEQKRSLRRKSRLVRPRGEVQSRNARRSGTGSREGTNACIEGH